ncbi:MAG: hypothetical protein GY851_31280 [bacterium]|nr:hypothetical protein [bacterium]
MSSLGARTPALGNQEDSTSTEPTLSTTSTSSTDQASGEPLKAANGALASSEDELTTEEQQELRQLKSRDQEVRRHEQAHVAAGGGYVKGGARLKYTTGPDGKRYASGGDVRIEVGAERTPEATVRKMQQIKRAALAPAKPSAQDRAVYRGAANQETVARQKLAEARSREAGMEPDATSDAQPPESVNEPKPGAPPSQAKGGSILRRAAANAYEARETADASGPVSESPVSDDPVTGPSVRSLDLRI